MVRPPINQNEEKRVESALKKGPWSAEEDQKLGAYIKRYGIWNWNHMAKPAGLARSGKSCRLRWMNYLRPNIKHGNISKEEEQTIIELHKVLGNRWAAISSKLPGRTDNEVKNYWNTRLKKRNILLNQHSSPRADINKANSVATQRHHYIDQNSDNYCKSISSSEPDDTKVDPTTALKVEPVSIDSSAVQCAFAGADGLWEETYLSTLLENAYLEDDFMLMVLKDLWTNPTLTRTFLGHTDMST